MSELREDIRKGIGYMAFDDQEDEQINAILDAVIASLPKEIEDTDEFSDGYNSAIASIHVKLTKAKSISSHLNTLINDIIDRIPKEDKKIWHDVRDFLESKKETP